MIKVTESLLNRTASQGMYHLGSLRRLSVITFITLRLDFVKLLNWTLVDLLEYRSMLID